jgi:hypothetical protein
LNIHQKLKNITKANEKTSLARTHHNHAHPLGWEYRSRKERSLAKSACKGREFRDWEIPQIMGPPEYFKRNVLISLGSIFHVLRQFDNNRNFQKLKFRTEFNISMKRYAGELPKHARKEITLLRSRLCSGNNQSARARSFR